jgi:hypothetical protein
LSVEPLELTFAAQSGEIVAPLAVTVSSSGSLLAWTAKVSAPWILITPVSDVTPSAMQVRVFGEGLAPDDYRGTIAIAPVGQTPAETEVSRLIIVVRLSLTSPGWELGNGPFGGPVLSVATDGVSGGRVIAGDGRGVVWLSDDGGQAFRRGDQLGDRVNDLKMDLASGTAYAAVTSTGVWRSDDKGDTWTQTSYAAGAELLAIRPGDPAAVFVRNSQRTDVAFSSNGGQSWQSVWNGSGLGCLFAGPADPSEVLLCYGYGLYRSTDSGQNWTTITSYAGWPWGWSAYRDELDPNIMYVASCCQPSISRSTDGGLTWTDISNGGPAPATYGPQSLVRGGNRLVLSSNDGLRQSSDGVLWTQVPFADLLPTQNFSEAATIGEALVVGHLQAGVYVGQAEMAAASGILAHSISYIDVHPTTGDALALADNTTVCRFDHGTATWHPLARLPADVSIVGSAMLVRDPQDPIRVLLAQHCGGLWESLDDGNTWVAVGAGAGNCVRMLSWAPDDVNTVYAVADGAVSVSHDRGLTFSPEVIISSGNGKAVAGLPGGSLVYWKDNSLGALHTPSGDIALTGLSGAAAVTVTADGSIWAGGAGGIFYFAPGSTAGQLRLGNSGMAVAKIVVGGSNVWVGYDGGGLVRSTDGGLAWQDAHSPTSRVTALAAGAGDGRIWVGTGDLGVLRFKP